MSLLRHGRADAGDNSKHAPYRNNSGQVCSLTASAQARSADRSARLTAKPLGLQMSRTDAGLSGLRSAYVAKGYYGEVG